MFVFFFFYCIILSKAPGNFHSEMYWCEKLLVLNKKRTHDLEYQPACSFEESTKISISFLVLWAPLSCTNALVKECILSPRCYRTPWQNQAVGLQTALSDEHTNRLPCRIFSLYSWACGLLLQVFLWLPDPSTVLLFSSCIVTFEE